MVSQSQKPLILFIGCSNRTGDNSNTAIAMRVAEKAVAISAKTETYFLKRKYPPKDKIEQATGIIFGMPVYFGHYPSLLGDGNSILTSEELATLFHFPIKVTGVSIPSVGRVESKKGGPPADLPIEE